jgi:phosphatidylserine decarboxylase
MNNDHPLKYFDRYRGQIIYDPIFAGNFLNWSYNTKLGTIFTNIFFRQKIVSQLYGWWHKKGWSKKKLKSFVASMNINMEESLCTMDEFKCFNDFFTRRIDLYFRPVKKDQHVCVSPCDGRVLVFPEIFPDQEFRIKLSNFNLTNFLQDESLVNSFSGGSMFVSHLYLTDYHHFHFPDSGKAELPYTITGKYYATSPYSSRSLVPIFKENYRMITLIDSENFGKIAMVEIGAFTVGSIKQQYTPNATIKKGDRKGYFELGGSTIVLLFQKEVIKFDADLCDNSKNKISTYILQGDSIGIAILE